MFSTFVIFCPQKALRIADAKAVEAKAARIKDWVTNKLRELEEQNAHLKVQNAKANDQMELLRNRLEQLQALGATTKSRQSSMAEVRKTTRLRYYENVHIFSIIRICYAKLTLLWLITFDF